MSLTIHRSGNKEAPAIVFLHGAGVSSWMWHEQIEALESRYHCIAVDLPGSGESHREEWRSMADTAEQVGEIVRREAVGRKAHIVGLSLGGYVALHLMKDVPEVVESMLVSGVTTRPFPNQWLIKAILPLMCRMLRWDWIIKLQIKLMQIPEDAHEIYRRDSKRMSVQMLLRVYDEVLQYELPKALGSKEKRLLGVAGDKEQKLVLRGLDDFAALEGGASAIAANAHHGWNGEHPGLFTEMIECWITQKSLPSALSHTSEQHRLLAVP